MDAPPKAHNGRREQDRALRIVTIMNMIPALGLLIASGVESRNAFPALGLIPMSMSCLIGMTALGSKREGSYVQCALPGADFATATFLMVMMVISWVTMATNYDLSSGNAMLGAYGLVPLMANFCIHTYISLRSPSFLFRSNPCPNCNHVPSPYWQRHITLPADDSGRPANHQHGARAHSAGPGHSRSSKEIYAQPFLHAYDGDARESSEFQTSGFNTPRQSAETLRPSEETLRSAARVSREGGSGDRKDAGSLV